MAKKHSAATGNTKRKLAELDAELVELLHKRAAAALGNPSAQLPPAAVQAVLRELEAGCREIAGPVRVAYLGPEFTFSHQAAVEQFGSTADFAAVATIAAVFEEVTRGTAQFGVVPLENSTDGRVTDTLECFAKSDLKISGELPLRIHHCLLGSGTRAEVRTVVSKPQALSQCRNWLASHLPQAELVPVASTADAARRAAADPQVAAISSRQAGVEQGLKVLAANIEDNADNVTRFAILSVAGADPTGNDKTALLFEIAHQPGSLADAMAIFKRRGLNMTWIESFPVAGSRGRYVFFVEFVGHATDVRARRALAALAKRATRLVVLGSYAVTEPVG